MNSKYRSRKVTVDGIVFDSVKESKRYQELKLLEKAGKIKELRTQVKYVLIPSQYEKVWDEKKQVWRMGKCIEREVTYIADFAYWSVTDCKDVVEDVKSAITRKRPEYVIKRKLMYYIHKIRINEV